jgi:hypothetical protein
LERRISALALSQKPTLELTQEFVETYKQKTAYEKYPLNTAWHWVALLGAVTK